MTLRRGERVLLDEEETFVVFGAHEPHRCLRKRKDIFSHDLCAVTDSGTQGQRPRDSDALLWSDDLRRIEQQNVSISGAVDEELEVVLYGLKSVVVKGPRSRCGLQITVDLAG